MIKFFTADWCKACQNLKQTLGEDIVSQLEVIDADNEPDEVISNNIRSIPTLIKFDEEGNEVSRRVGSMSVTEFKSWSGE